MNVRRTGLVLGAALLVFVTGSSPNEARAQSRSSYERRSRDRVDDLARTLLESSRTSRRAAAAEELGELGDERGLDALATASAHDSEPEVRRAARRAIRQIRDRGGYDSRPSIRDPNVEAVESYYQRYLGRAADRDGLLAFTRMLANGVSAEDVQAGIISSDEFWRLNGGRPEGFIRGVYQTVLGRKPTRQEMDVWGRRYNLLRGDRSRLAQEFFYAAQRELSNR